MKDISSINNGVKTGPSNRKGEGTSKAQIGKLPLSNWGGREEIFFKKSKNKDKYQGKTDGRQGNGGSK
jgi:hypothetical protein